MARKRRGIYLFAGAILLSVLSLVLFSCGSGVNPDPKAGSGKGNVALFITDNISMYKQVVSTITAVRLVNSGTGEVCPVLDRPVAFNLANLTNMAQYASLAECRAGKYNRIDIDFRRSVQFLDQNDTPSFCSYATFNHESGEKRPLRCDDSTGICTLSMRAGSRDRMTTVLEDRYNDLGIDFDLKKFTVTDYGLPASCAVNMQLSMVSAGDMNSSGRAHGVTGSIRDLDTVRRTFTLLAAHTTVTVDYAGINPALQPNVDTLLQAAVAKGLAVSVLTGSVDLINGSIAANRIFLKASGTVSAVQDQPTWTFSLDAGAAGTLAGSHKPPAVIHGSFADGAWVNVKFSGYDSMKARFLADAVEVLSPGIEIED